MNTYEPNAGAAVGGMLLVLSFLIVGYFIPMVIAIARRHRNVAPITIVNVFFGWSVLGWFIALIWAFTSDVYPPAAKT